MDIPLFEKLQSTLNLPSPLETVYFPGLNRMIFVKRDDLIHPIITGNKWRKLIGHIHAFYNGKHSDITSMGGVYSNHLHALAFTCDKLNIPCQAYIYGLRDNLENKVLRDVKNWGMQICPVSRHHAMEWRKAQENPLMSNTYWIPEGGVGKPASLGIKKLTEEFPPDFDRSENILLVPCGTGTTIKYILQHTENIRIYSLRIVSKENYDWENSPRFHWMFDQDKRSFAALKKNIIEFGMEFEKTSGFFLDDIYAKPLLYAALQYFKKNEMPGSLYYLHTGGVNLY